MGQAKQRGTPDERKASPQGDSWRAELNAVDVPRPPKAVRRNMPEDTAIARRSLGSPDMSLAVATLMGIHAAARLRRR